MKSISYIFPIYNETDNIELLHKTMTKVVSDLRKKYEVDFIFINDGSKDDSLEKLHVLAKNDKSVSVINFSRNYGHQIAVTAGLDYSTADAVIIMDSDMQDPPKVSLELINKWEEGFDVVYAQRRTRQDTFFKKLTADMFYRVLQKLADIDIPRNTGDFRLLDRKVVDELKKFKEHNRFLRGMVSFIGFNQTAVLFDRDERHAGVTGYPLKKMLKFAADGIFSFSNAPLRMIRTVGVVVATLSFIGILYAIIMKIVAPDVTIEGWTFIVISILFIGGVQLIMLGVLGSYIGRVYTEVQNRPLYGIASIVSSKKSK
jgi:dolichol-phosphate mannosyltransferase